MLRAFGKLPPVSQRTLLDDLKWGLALLTGVALGYLAFGDGDTGLLGGAVVGVVSVIIVLNLWRAVSRRRHRPSGR